MKLEISASDGSAIDEPITIYTGLDSYGFSMTNDNKKLIYSKYLIYSNLWELKLSERDGSFKTQQLTSGTTAIKYPVVSPDGSKIAFVNRGNIFIKQFSGNITQQITFLNSECCSPSFSPDGIQLAFFSGSSIMVISLQGVIKKVFKDIEMGAQLHWNTDSTILYLKPGNINFYSLNLKSGAKKQYIKDENTSWMYNHISSPYRKKIAVYWDKKMNGLWSISLKDSLQNLVMGGRLFPLKWSQDGKTIYAFEFESTKILAVSTRDGSAKEHIKIPFYGVNAINDDIDITPDGKTIICTVPGVNSDVWMIENFDPDVE
jgi:Tol biopolymer transport system component